MKNVNILNNTSDYILIYVNGELHKLQSGETLKYSNGNTHPMVITGMFFYEVITDFKVIGTYDLDTVIEIEGSGDILVRDPM